MQSLLPARFADIRIPLMNLGNEVRIVPKGTYLGRLYEAEVVSIPEEDENEVPQIRRIASPDPNELAKENNPMVGWSRQRRDGMRSIIERYQNDMTELGISSEILLVKVKEPDEGGSIKWWIDCRQLPKYLDAEIPAIHHLTRPPEETTNSSDESEYFEVLDEVDESGLTEAVESTDLDEVLLLDEVPEEDLHGNADGLSRRPSQDKVLEAVRVLRKFQSGTPVLAGESLHILQYRDIELGPIIRFRLRSDEPPSHNELQSESEITKKLATKWDRLVVVDELVYLKDKPAKRGERPRLRLLLPRVVVDKGLRLCHAGTVGGHFGFRKSIDQIRLTFFWNNWKEDTKRFIRGCDKCTKYHRGKLAKQGPLQPRSSVRTLVH